MALKHVVNMHEASWQQNVKDKDLTAPPGTPAEGDRYIVAAGASGAWAGQSGKIAYYYLAVWNFDAPTEGWKAWVEDEDKTYTFTGTVWQFIDMQTTVYDTDNNGIVDRAETVDDGAGNVTTAAQVKTAYDRRGSYVSSLKAIEFDLP